MSMPIGKARPVEHIAPVDTSNTILKSFENLFLEHWPRVYSLLARMLGDRAEAEDVALETFMRLYQRPPTRDDNLAGWLARVATHLGLNALRSQKRRQFYEQTGGKLDWLEHQESTPAELFAEEEQRRRVRLVLSHMDTRNAQILVLRHSGYSYREIASALNLAPTSIGPLLVRAESDFERRYKELDS